MLTLFCGSAVPIARAQRLSLPLAATTMFIVPDDVSATGLTREIYGRQPGCDAGTQIWTFQDILEVMTGGVHHLATTVSPAIALAVVRNIIDTAPKSFDYLVGKYSVPRMSQGVLTRILRSLETLRNLQPTDDDTATLSPRMRQLRLLEQKFEERLKAGGYRLQQYAEREALGQVSQEHWDRIFPGVRHVVFLDFLDHSDTTYLLIGAVSRHVEQCDVLLDFDPELDHTASAMDTAYQRLYDMAEQLILSPMDLPREAPTDVVAGDGGIMPFTVRASTVSQEVQKAAAAIHRLLEDAIDGEVPSVVVALPNWSEYAPILEKEFTDFGIRAVWQETESTVRGGEWLLLERLRECCGKGLVGTAVSSLLRAPGFSSLVQGRVSAIEAWDLASRLDYVLTMTGQLQGWRSIHAGVKMVIQRLQNERKRRGQWSDEEGDQDARLLDLLKWTETAVQPLLRKASVREWCRQVIGILHGFEAATPHVWSDLSLARMHELKKSISELARFGALVSYDDVNYSSFLTLVRTVNQDAWVGNDEALQELPVTVCSPSVACRLRSDCCMVLGCNDGNFPAFARPDAAFLGYSFHTNQAAFRARQRAVLDRILRNHSRVLFWMPERVGTEERLPSQFLEDLLAAERTREIKAEDLLLAMKAQQQGLRNMLQREFVENLKGLVLNPSELQRFAQRGPLSLNIASNMSVLASRSQALLSGYDGIITDPKLKDWLASWSDAHIYSVSQLDSVVGCSFRFFADRMLHLEDLEEADDLLPAHIFGSVVHDVLARFYRDWVDSGRGVPRLEDEPLAREKLLEAFYVEQDKFPDVSDFARDLLNLKLFGDLGADGFGDSQRLLQDVRDPGLLGQFLQMEVAREAESATDFLKPSNFEVGFGMGTMAEDDPLTLPEHLELDLGEGELIKLRGRIDRIDISPSGVFAVTDYKTGRLPEKGEILGGFRTQLPVYLMVAEQLLSAKIPGPEPAGGLYYSLRKGVDKVNGVFFRSLYQMQAGVKGRGLKDEDFYATLETVRSHIRHSLRSVRRGYLTTTRHDPETVCRYCPFDGFCYKNVERTELFWQKMEADSDAEEPASAS